MCSDDVRHQWLLLLWCQTSARTHSCCASSCPTPAEVGQVLSPCFAADAKGEPHVACCVRSPRDCLPSAHLRPGWVEIDHSVGSRSGSKWSIPNRYAHCQSDQTSLPSSSLYSAPWVTWNNRFLSFERQAGFRPPSDAPWANGPPKLGAISTGHPSNQGALATWALLCAVNGRVQCGSYEDAVGEK